MSMHKIPLTQWEEAGLRAHGLDVGTPSQLSDCFRHGMAWAICKLSAAGKIRDHITDGSPCWCNPETTYISPETGGEVIVHKEPQ